MALVRGLLGAKRIINFSVPVTSKRTFSAQRGFLRCTLVKTSKSEEEFGFDHPMGGLTIPCPDDTFINVTSQLQ
ncbi:hypothetical protein F2Q70_00014461 [Brassica cretica]|uniref:Uncharacterized protein n=1 Tax=Brassica cretica TaxID=69181 RepID=A0A8S9KTZ2_BRACR|nr:hypothetical protein F2Q70_00014461 [Brassica cretica]KAF2597161.1 hypothetical protein F2Q68_00007481 [Brassica cretica]